MRTVAAGLLPGLLLTGCVDSAIPHAPAPIGYASMVKKGAVGSDRARLVAFKGQILTSPIDSGAPEDPATGDLVVNGIDIGGVNPGQALAIDLPPATYSVRWRDSGDTGLQSPPLSLPLVAGQILYVSMDRRMPQPSGPLPIGGLAAPVAGALLQAAVGVPSGPVLAVRRDGSTRIQTMEIVGTVPAARRLAEGP